MIKVTLIALLGVMFALQLKGTKGEFGLYLIFAAGLVILGQSLEAFASFLEQWKDMMNALPIDKTLLTGLTKMIGIAFLSQFAGGICKDAGYQGLAMEVDTFGKIGTLLIGMPILLSFLEAVKAFGGEGGGG